ncbi:MAG: hypothetical protein ACKVOQ_21895 [Cyclobacteriaceae bacterium]
MNILAFLFIAGLILKGIFILIESSIERMSLKYDTKIILLPIHEEQEDFATEMKIEVEIEASPNSLKPLGKQIHLRTAS